MGDHNICPSCGGESLSPPQSGCAEPNVNHPPLRKFEGEVLIEIDLAGDEDAAFAAIDKIMQSAWDRTQGGTTIGGPKWHFTMLDTAVAEVDEIVKEPR